MSSFLKEGIKPKYMGKISRTNNLGSTEVEHRYSLLKKRKFIFRNFLKKKEHLIYGKFIGSGAFKTFYRIKKDETSTEIDNYIFGKYENNKNEDVGLKKQKELKGNSNNNYIPDIIDIGCLNLWLNEKVLPDNQNKHSYVIMERVTGIEFADLVDFILQSCLIFNDVGDCIRFKTKEELANEDINKLSVQFKFFSEVILQPLNVRVNILKYLFQELLNAVNEIHKSGNLHLDIKLPNMMIIYDETESNPNEKFKVKIIDFGLCTKKDSLLSPTGTIPYFNKNLLCYVRDSKLKDEIYCRNSNSNDPNYYKKLIKHLTVDFKQNQLWLTKDTFDEKEDIYPLGLMFQVIFVICILNANEFNEYFKYFMYDIHTKKNVNIKLKNYKKKSWDVGWDPGMNLGHFIENFDFIKYIYKNIIELFLLSNNDTLNDDTQNLDNVEDLFHSIDLFTNLKTYFQNEEAELHNIGNTLVSGTLINSLLIEEVNGFYYRNQEPGTDSVKDTNLFKKIKKLTSATGEARKTKKICQQCFLLLKIVRKMLDTGVSEYNNIDEILNELINFNNDFTLDTVQKEALEFVCDTDYSSSTLGGGSRQVGGVVLVHKKSIEAQTDSEKFLHTPVVIAPSSPKSPIEETQVINLKNLLLYKDVVNKLFQEHYHSSFDMDDYLKEETINIGGVEKSIKNKIFIKPISRIPYEKIEPFLGESNPSKSKITEPFTKKQQELIDKINEHSDKSKKNKLKKYFSVLFPETDTSTIEPKEYKGRNVSFRKTIGLIDREVCYKILNDTETFSGGRNERLQTQLKKAFGFTGPISFEKLKSSLGFTESISLEELKEKLKEVFGFTEPISLEQLKEVFGFTETISLEELKEQLKKDFGFTKELINAFGFTETNSTVVNSGGFRKKRQSSKTKKRQSSKTKKRKLSKTNKRQSSKNNKRKSSTLGNKITLKNKKYKNVSKRKNHLKVIKTKITKKK
tara:strand:- start:355 stop:3255 length:2901 start_codon:yes stop_codon:yes gene_type:complete